jgi:pyridoxamine 5'-phosphate oxidase
MSVDPFGRFAQWFAEAEASEPNDPNAMILATATAEGRPSARTVLLKAWDAGGFVFYTNLESRKSEELKQNPRAALLFYWKILHRQVRIEGAISLVDDAQADAYFASRPRGSRIGAWTSAQSRPLADRETFERELAEVEARFPTEDIPRPGFWSGWRLVPDYLEFWQDQRFRLHDRETYTFNKEGWLMGRLYP